MDVETAPVAEVAPAPADAKAEPVSVSPLLDSAQKRAARASVLCEKASKPDYLYIGVLLALDVGAIALDSQYAKFGDSLTIRLAGPAFIGLSWGATLGSLPLIMPQCEWPGTARVLGPEASTHSDLPLMLTLAAFAGATAPFLVGLETGPVPRYWPVSERSGRLIASGLGGALGALIPHLIPPKPFRAIRELRNLDVAVTGSELSVRFQF